MILESTRVILRSLKSEDLETLHSWREDLELRGKTMMHPFPVTLEQDKEWLTRRLDAIDNKQVVFAIVSKEDGLLIGYINLRDIDLLHKHAFLGIMIGSPEHRNKGIGSEAVSLVLKYGFEFLGLLKISLDVIKSNVAALRVYKKLGFIEEGIFHKHFYFNNEHHDVVRLAVFKGEESGQ